MDAVALITGASSGIGLATTNALANAGWHVVATARRPEQSAALQELAAASPGVELRSLDVTSDESVAACVGGVLADHGRIDLLVNNAGAGYRGTLEQISLEELAGSLDLNFFGVARVTKAVLPTMRVARAGRIITVTSLGGIVALPFSDAYNAGKFAVEGLMEALAAVMREFGVFVSVLEPGAVRTSFFANIGGYARGVADDDPYRELVTRMSGRIAAMGEAGQSPEEVADVIRRIAEDPAPALRYQPSDSARAMAAQKLVDTTGRTVLAATGALLAP